MKLDRVHIAHGFVERLKVVGTKKAVKELAALMLEERLHEQIEEILLDISDEYARQYGLVEAHAVSAFPLSAELKKELTQLVRKSTGAKSVVLHEEIDKSLLGGVVVTAPDMQLDLSLKTKLMKLRTYGRI